jgi:hypothetical protein
MGFPLFDFWVKNPDRHGRIHTIASAGMHLFSVSLVRIFLFLDPHGSGQAQRGFRLPFESALSIKSS